MKSIFIFTLFSILSLFLIKCGHVPATYYYQISYELPRPDTLKSSIPATIGVREFEVDVVYKGDKIVYRNSPYEIQYYHYRRWIAPPRKLVKEKIVEQLKSSGNFKNVVSLPSTHHTDFVLAGKIKAFEEWDQDNSWYGMVTLAMELYHNETGEIIWEDVLSEKTETTKKEPLEVVKAISISLQKVIERARKAIKLKLRSQK
jgi:ABC-type uncharacterized transport system auxiliary subunit